MLRWCATTCKEGVASLPVGSNRGREWPLRWRADPVAILWEKSQWFQLYNNIYSNSYSNKSESTWENSGFEIFSSMAACCFMESCGLKFHFNRGGKFAGRQICREWCASEPLDWFLGWPFLPFLHFFKTSWKLFFWCSWRNFCGCFVAVHIVHTVSTQWNWLRNDEALWFLLELIRWGPEGRNSRTPQPGEALLSQLFVSWADCRRTGNPRKLWLWLKQRSHPRMKSPGASMLKLDLWQVCSR